MLSMKKNFDEIGYWSEIKLDIVKEYAKAYSTIMSGEKQKSFYHIYINGFSGAGKHFSKASQDFVPGSPLNALLIKPPFREYHLIDLDGDKIGELRKIVEKLCLCSRSRKNGKKIILIPQHFTF